MASDEKTRNADFVGRIVGDAKNPPETRVLTGWFGDSGEEGYRRLYTDAGLANYVDIPSDAILYSEPLRDVQPAGAVMVWIKADAALKPGGTAASRAARFLQGQVQQDFSTPEKAGYRCVTQPPCGEPTGFTGQCTKEPQVGGAWPCITALPLCSAEPTGFTGKCTDQPWPNPTQYFGCTYYHCPTQDLTHVPWICNAVAAGGQPQGGAAPEAQRAAGNDAAAIPPTNIPGCGYTKTWGLCETHLLGCGYTKNWGLCNAQQRQPQNFAFEAAGAPPQAAPISVTIIVCCNPSAIDACPTRFQCPTPATQCTQGGPECATHNSPRCPTHNPCCTQAGPHCPNTNVQLDCTFGCTLGGPNCPDTGIVCVNNPNVAAQQFGAPEAAGGGFQITLLTIPVWNCIAPTPATRCFICPPKPSPWFCTPPVSIGIACTVVQCGPGGGGGAEAAGGAAFNQAAAAPGAGRVGVSSFNCPTPATFCFWCPPATFGGGDCGGTIAFAQGRQFGAEAAAAPGIARTPFCPATPWCPQPSRFVICPPTPMIFCPPPSALDDCPSRFCGGGGGAFAARAAGGIGPQLTDVLCPTVTIFTPQCVIVDTTRVGCVPTQGCPPPTPFCPPPQTPGCPTLGCPPTPGPVCPSVLAVCTLFEPQCPGGQGFDVGRFAPAPHPTLATGCLVNRPLAPSPLVTQCFAWGPPMYCL